MGRGRICARGYWLVVFGVLICAGIGITVNYSQGHKGIIKLAATVAQQPAEASEPNQDVGPRRSSPPPAPQPPQQANPAVSAVTQEAVKFGVLSCVSRINQVATFLTANNQSGVYIFPVSKEQPDQHVFSTSFELVRPDSSTIYASASFFPNQDAVYDTVEYVNMSCEEAEKTLFKNLKRVGVVKKNIILLDGGAVKVFLMPAGSGCVVIKKEVVQ